VSTPQEKVAGVGLLSWIKLLLFSVVSELNMNVDYQHTKHPVLGQLELHESGT
jgi:hypothetical protein